MDSTTREKKGFKWIVFLIPTTVNVWVVNRLSLYSNNMCTCIIIETWIYSDVGLKLNFSIQTIFPPLWPPLRTHVVVCVWWGHDTFRYDHCLECELAPAFPYWFLAQFTWFHMYLSLFACRCKYFSKCKSIKVAMSSSRACYSQLGPWSKLEHTHIKMENTTRKSLDVLHLGHLLTRPARASNPSWRPNRIRPRVCFGLQEQLALKWTPRSHTGSDLGTLYMVGKIIPRRF